MSKILRLFVFILWLPVYCLAETLPGYDVLAVAQYCERYLKAPRLPAVSTLLNTFGDPLPCIEKAVQRGGLELVQIDLIDATCWRNRVCPPGVPRPDDLKAIEKRAQSVQKLAVKYPGTKWSVSPALEHDVKDAKKVQAMMNAAKKGCPNCDVINSPFSGARNSPLELHGTKVSAFSVSGDGASIFDADNLKSDCSKELEQSGKCKEFEHNQSGSYSTFAWFNELNLRCTGEKNFTPPLKRTERPTADLFAQAYQVMQREPAIPASPGLCKTVRTVDKSKGEIVKPNAESYCNGQQKDKRGNRPLLLLAKHGKAGDKLKVYNSGGKEVGCFRYYGKFSDPRLGRWYMGDCSGQTPAQLFKDLGSEWGFAHLGGGACLRFNSVRRMGVYR
jgi:hypothetical protein